jgi:hypothetical protein
MGFFGFDVETSKGSSIHFLFAHQAKEQARRLVHDGVARWARVRDCESGLVVKQVGDPNAAEEPSCDDALRLFCIALAGASGLPADLNVAEVEDANAGTCIVRFRSAPTISGSTKLGERLDVFLRLAPGTLEDWAAGEATVEAVCQAAAVTGDVALAPFRT